MNAWNRLCQSVLEDTSSTGTKFSTLDGLRGLAVLTVFLSHSSGFRQRLTPWTSFHGLGHLGVYLFFVLSGFLLGWSLLAASRVEFGRFYRRRFFRIAPLFYLVATIVFLRQRFTGNVDHFNLFIDGNFFGYIKHLLFIQGDSVFWTIAAEFEFYLIMPIIALALIKGGRAFAGFLAVLATSYCLWFVSIQCGILDPKYSLKLAHIPHHSQFLDVFICGILAAWSFREAGALGLEKCRVWLHPLATVLAIGVLVVPLALVAENFFGFGRFWFRESPLHEALGLARLDVRDLSILWGLSFAIISLATLNGHRLFVALMNGRGLRMIGVTGFSWYLVHFPILRLVNHLYGLQSTAGGFVPWTFREPCALATSFALASGLAVILYLNVEKPFMMISRRRRPQPAPVPTLV